MKRFLLLLALTGEAHAESVRRIETQSGRIDLIAKDPDAATNAVLKSLTALGGYFLEITDEGIVCKVPVRGFAALRQVAAKQGTVLNEAVEAVDVAEERRRLLATLAGKRAMTKQYMSLLTASVSRADIVKVQIALMDLTSQIESLAGRLQLLDHQLKYATLNVSFDRGKRPNVRFAGLGGVSSFKWVNTVGVDHLIADFGRAMGTRIEPGEAPRREDERPEPYEDDQREDLEDIVEQMEPHDD